MAEQERSYSSISSDLGSNRNKVVTKKTTTVVPYDINSGVIPPPGTQEEWTTTKRRINHKTKQVETRVQRQIIMEDGKVIADSGPQVTTKTTEDQKSDETEDTKHRKLGDSEVPEKYRKDIGNQVVAEKTVTHNVTKEAKEENYQYHDESLRELDGPEIHRKAVEAPHKLISIENEIPSIPRGKLVHFSAKGRKTNDRDEILEVSRLDKDGMLNTETTQTQYHEELEDDEVPEDGPKMLERENSDHHHHHQQNRHQLEYGGGQDHDRSSRNSSSLSMSRGQEKMKSSKRGKDTYSKRRDPKSSTGMIGDDDIVETSEVYRLSDKMRSLKTNKKNTKSKSTRKDDASTQASMSDLNSGDEDEGHRHSSTNAEHLHEVHERFGSRRSSFHTHDDECCDLMVHKPGKQKQQYYYGTESAKPATSNGNEKGFISANVKTSKFAMENDRVIEDKNFEEDFERSFKDKAEKFDVRRDYDRFLERTMEPTKAIRDRAISPKLPPSGSSTSEFIHRPLLVGSSGDQFEPYSDTGKPARSRSFYNHQIDEYENSKTRKSYDQTTSTPLGSGYSSLPYRDQFGSSHRVSSPSNSGTWTKHTTRDHSHRFDSHRSTSTGTGDGKYRQSSGRSDFPDFAPLSSPYEIKSLSENSMKTRHLTSYN